MPQCSAFYQFKGFCAAKSIKGLIFILVQKRSCFTTDNFFLGFTIEGHPVTISAK